MRRLTNLACSIAIIFAMDAGSYKLAMCAWVLMLFNILTDETRR